MKQILQFKYQLIKIILIVLFLFFVKYKSLLYSILYFTFLIYNKILFISFEFNFENFSEI